MSDEENGKKPRNGRKMTRHHVIPRSRGGGELEENIKRMPDRYHTAWHIFFGNLTPKEAIVFVKRIFVQKRKSNKWKMRDFYLLQLQIQEETFRRGKKKKKKYK